MTAHGWIVATLLFVVASAGCSGPRADSARDPDDVTAASLQQRLTDEQKAGQLFQAWMLSRADAAAFDKVATLVRDGVIGGVILSLGTAAEAVDKVERLQRLAPIPLLFSGDFEGGVGFRLSDATMLGPQMLIAATGLPRLAYACGAVTAAETRALGVHVAYAPVADVNVDPRNPIIHVRSFGEDPGRVATFVAATVRGIESGSVMACAKHFPGHGDVASDSHLTMPTVPGDRARLDRVELPPFRAAIEAGVSFVMTGHLAVPGLGEDAEVPATLSPRILTDVLRTELGFRGLVVTDALDMGGVRESIDPTEAAVRALIAGADVLLMPPDAVAARAAVVAAVASGRVPRVRFEAAVARVLAAKERAGLLRGEGRPRADWRTVVGCAEHRAVAETIAARGITLVRDASSRVPLRAGTRATLVTLSERAPAGQPDADAGDANLDAQGVALHAALAAAGRVGTHVRVHANSTPAELDAARTAIATADTLVVALHVGVRSYAGRIGVPVAWQPLLAAIDARADAVVVSFGNPYLVTELPRVGAYLAAYASHPIVERAVALALAGATPINGRLPISIPGVAAIGDGVSRFAAAPSEARPQDEGLPANLAPRLERVLAAAVASRVTPGAVCLVSRRGRIVANVAVGNADFVAYGNPPPNATTPYDLASLTKVCATTPLLLRLAAAGVIDVDARVAAAVPAFAGSGKDDVTLRDLMLHESGLPAYVAFHESLTGADAIVDAAARTPLAHPPRTKFVYSDLGLILAMRVVERQTSRRFDELCAREVFAPLGMTGATFWHIGTPPIDAPPTEQDDRRGKLVRGEVHDENAWAMGGVSGHAGLFGSAHDVLRIAHAFLGGAAVPEPWLGLATRPAARITGSSRAFGFDTYPSFKTSSQRPAFGHTGFTGTSLRCDPASDVAVVLLTNRVRMTRDPKGIAELRRAVHALVADALREGGGTD